MKTKCCHTRHFQVVDKKKVCVNPRCENYLSFTVCYLEQTRIRRAVCAGIFAISLLFTFHDYSNTGKNYNQDYMLRANFAEKVPLNLTNLKAEIVRNELLCADEVFAQIR